MEFLRDISVNLLANMLWVGLVFVVLFIRDRRKKRQIGFCLEAYLTFLFRSIGAMRNAIYPYVYMVENKIIQGTILTTLLDHIYHLTSTVAVQTQNILPMVESRNLQEKILRLYYKLSTFQTHVSDSQVATNIIVGNITELVEAPRGEEEMRLSVRFCKDFETVVNEIAQNIPEEIRQRIPQEILQALKQQAPFQERYQKLAE
jgi:hypothetical protein